jgi:membrane protein YdbS with pleckstrin-like domain
MAVHLPPLLTSGISFFASNRQASFSFNGVAGMSYVKHVIQPGEKILVDGRLSWVLYLPAILYLIVGLVLVAVKNAFGLWYQPLIMIGTVAVFGILTLVSAANAWFKRWTTEIAVTDKRIIFKTGFINRHTEEMNMDKVSSVDVDQSFWGRIFDFGTIRILGAGGAGRRDKNDKSESRPGIERLDMIGSPIELRNAIDVH